MLKHLYSRKTLAVLGTVHRTFTTLWANSPDDKLMIDFFYFPENSLGISGQLGHNLHEILKPIFWKTKRTLSRCRLLKFVPKMLSVKYKTTTYLEDWISL